jgi:outer membrane protein assembly factor BamD
LIPCILLTLILGFTLSRPALAERDAPSVAEEYELGQRFLKRGYYVKAMEQFNRIRNYHRDDPYAVKAGLAIADLYYAKGEWDQARLSYMDFQRSHPRHEDLDYVVYRIGLSVYRKAPRIAARDQIWTRQTVNQWTGFGSRFPESEYLPEVSEKLLECQERLAKKELVIAEFYVRREAWKAVRGRVEGLLHSWPESQYVPDALALLAQAQAWEGDLETALRTMARLAELDAQQAEALKSRLDRIPKATNPDSTRH